ncbi:WD40-repeat-containing domain protein [Ilyonectria robusta]|uniref:WD40-repeat-containing domain protein n=1 Tax=Ilyonectria robusta TaxID=1079257 RepID=UPI001E8EDC1A|nr:WD40-repeat-containing domain protein [Ilyonectria robusta]KAH8694349.1 WD40-repeat-containing domain protein [Ilyonectria robusta]
MTSVAISPDSKLVATSSYDKTTRIWHVDTGECISQLRGHTEALASAAFSPDSKLVATAALDKTVLIWSVENIYHQQSSKGHAHQVEAVTLAPNRDLVASGSQCDWPYYGLAIANNGTWITWKNRKLLWLPVPFRPHCSNIFGSSIAIGCTSGRVVFFTLKASELMKLENFSEPLVLDNPVLGWRRSREGRPVPAP